jgi:hypothetical protein
MEAGKFSFKFSRQTQKNLVGSSKYAYFSAALIWGGGIIPEIGGVVIIPEMKDSNNPHTN